MRVKFSFPRRILTAKRFFCIVKTKDLAHERSLVSRLNSGFHLCVHVRTMTTQSVGITNRLWPRNSSIADILMEAAVKKSQLRNQFFCVSDRSVVRFKSQPGYSNLVTVLDQVLREPKRGHVGGVRNGTDH